MKMKFFILLLLFLTISCVSATEIDSNSNVTSDDYTIADLNSYSVTDANNYSVSDDSYQDSNLLESDSDFNEVVQDSQKEDLLESGSDFNDLIRDSQVDDVIEVDSWDELQYYCSLKDKDYTLKLKDNTNFYPTKTGDSNYQIRVYNNVKIIGGNGSYIGDSSSSPRTISYAAIVVPDGYKSSIFLENVTFKQIQCGYPTDGVFFKLGGSLNSVLKNCLFENIVTYQGHSSIVHLSKGTATLENCSFINCNNGYGCVSIYDPNSVKTVSMIVRDCYFEGNYASTEPGCINNCGSLTVYNTTFYKNRAAAWAGGIHTHNGGNTTIYDSNFTDNVAGWNGGALYTYSYLQIYNTVFDGNNCTTNNGGGAIGACSYLSDPHIYIENSLFINNENLCWSLDDLSTSGTGRGGAISIMDSGSFVVLNTTFIANSASIGSAICAWAMGGYGSPDMIIVNNTFINHTRVSDVLNVRADGTIVNISNNYFYGNSIPFSKLALTALSVGDSQAVLQINISLSNPSFYDEDILNRTLFDVYVDNEYYRTVNSTVFTFDFEDWDICDVYVVPTISNAKSNMVNLVSTREYIFVSKSRGNDSNDGVSRQSPVSSIKRALELAGSCHNILLLDGDYDEEAFQIDYDLTIKGEGNSTLSNKTSFLVNCDNFCLKNLNVNNLDCDVFVKQAYGNLVVEKCIFEDNDAGEIIDACNVTVLKSVFKNNGATVIDNNAYAVIKDSILLNNAKLIDGDNENVILDYNWWGNTLNNISKPNSYNLNNWLLLNSTVSKSVLENGQSSIVQFAFYLIENNQVTRYDDLVKVNYEISTVNGASSQNITNFNSKVVYTQTGFGDGVLTVAYDNVSMDTNFVFVKSDPRISIQTNNIKVGNPLTIRITAVDALGGNLTVSVGNVSQTKCMDSRTVDFVFNNIKAGDYVVVANYSGDRKYASQVKYSKVSATKSDSSTRISVKVKGDATITISCNLDATGIVTLSINGVSENHTLSGGKYVHTLKNVARGDYLIKAVYNGNDKYLASEYSYLLEVDNADPTLNISILNCVYGSDAIINVVLDDNATGNISVTIDGVTNFSEIVNSTATVRIAGLNAGMNKKVTIAYTGDDTYYSKAVTRYMTVEKADFTFNMTSSDIRIGQDAVIYITVPRRTSGNFTIGDVVLSIPLSGEVSYVIPDLDMGEYEFTAIYNGDNYNTVSNSTSFNVLEYPIPQWGNDGGDIYNTHKSNYVSSSYGAVIWSSQINSTIIGNLAIDSEGNLYLSAVDGIYSFDVDGALRWIYSSPGREGNFSGIAISRDVVISPRMGDTLYLINQSTGEKYGNSNIYQASSLFSPIVDNNAVIYTVSEYQFDTNSYDLVITPYKLWTSGGTPNMVNLGSTKPIAAPSVNDDVYVVLGENRLMVIDANSLETLFIKSGSFNNVRPVISEGNVIYASLGNSIVAYTNGGAQLWKTNVAGGLPRHFALDSELGLYAVSDNGHIYRYDLVDGSGEMISDLEITSGLLVGGNGNLYFAVGETFYGINSHGEVLWKSNLGSVITSTPVMDDQGVIYVTSIDNKIFALGIGALSDCNLSVEVDDIDFGSDALVKIGIDNQTTGSLLINVDGTSYEELVSGGVVLKVISGLAPGIHQVNVSYSGDVRFNSSFKSVNFTVRDYANVNVSVSDSLLVVVLPSDATGTLTVSIDGVNQTKSLVGGKASFDISNLNPGTHACSVFYSGDVKYASVVKTCNVKVYNPKLTGANLVMAYTSNSYYKVRLTKNNIPLSGKSIVFMVNGKKYSAKTNANGYASVKISLPPKTYSVSASYGNLKVSNKVTVKSIITAKNMNAKKSAKSVKIKVILSKVDKKYLSNKVVSLKFNGKTYKVKTSSKGVATFTLKNTAYNKVKVGKKYTYQVIYAKDKVTKTIKFSK